MDRKFICLLVEDNLVARMGAKITLEQMGCQLDETESGEEAIKLAIAKKYDVIFMDIGLAGKIDGFEAIEKICNNYPKDLFPVFYVITAHKDGLPDHAAKKYVTDILEKPLLPEKCRAIFDKLK